MTPSGCPSCSAPLTGAPVCASCGLPLSGPLAGRLWQVDQQLAVLTVERTHLLERLRGGEVGATAVATTAWPGPPDATSWAVPAAAKESSPQQVQNTLLTLGALLLALAGVVFTAVTYRHLGVVGRALVLLVLTAAAAWAPTQLLWRKLTASAEALTGVALALMLLDAYALRRAGLAKDADPSSYSAVASAVVAAAVGAYSLRVPVRTARYAAMLLAQLPVPFVLQRIDASASVVAVVLAVQGGVDLAVADRAPLPSAVRRLAGALGGLFAVVALIADAGAVADGQRGAWAGFAVLGALAATASWQARDATLRDALALPVVPLLAASGWAGVRPRLTTTQEPLVLVAVAVLAVQVIALLPRDRRSGPTYGALAVTAVTLLAEAGPVLQAVAGPFAWLADPWTRTADSARLALGPGLDWDGSVVTLVVLASAALVAVTSGLVLDRVTQALPVAGALLVLTAVALPLGLATSYHDALLLLLLVAGVLAGSGVALLDRHRLVALSLVSSGTATALLAAVWSTADKESTLTVVALAAALCAGLAFPLPGFLTGVALLLGSAELAAVGASRGLAVDQVGGLLLAAVAVCVGLSWATRELHRLGAEAAAAIVATAGIACAAGDPGWLSWTLGASGLGALVVAVRPDRRLVGLLGGLLLSASSWVRLADAHVHAPEPYVAPLAAAALAAGLLRRRSHPTAGSWECYGTALSLALVPSLLRSFADTTPTRGLLLLVVAVTVVVVGGRARLQAPLVLGSATVVLDGIGLLAPYASALPRWTLLAGAGLVLVLLGATYEQRLRDLQRLRDKYDAFA